MKTSNLVLAGIVAVWGLTSAVVTLQSIQGIAMPALGQIVDGSASQAFEKAYKKRAFYRSAAEEGYGTLRFATFGEGRKGVIVGKDNWLFTAEEIALTRGQEARLKAELAFMNRIREELASRNVRLVLALLPEKADIYREKLVPARAGDGDLGLKNYAAFRKWLTAEGFEVPDLRQPLLDRKAEGEVFLRTDTHWTPAGAAAAAEALGAYLGPVSNTGFRLAKGGQTEITGDLTRYISAGRLRAAKAYGPETLQRMALDGPAAGSNDIFADEAIPVTLVGTSYSANPDWGFELALKASLQSDVLNVAEIGQGPFKPIQAYLDSDAFRSNPPRLVIWEIPLRYLGAEDRSVLPNPLEVSPASAEAPRSQTASVLP